MLGKQSDQQVLFQIVNLSELISEDHFLKKVDRVMDFNFVRELSEEFYCKDNGRPSIDPETYFRIVLLSYLYGISSDRRICEEIRYNVAYRWFCRLSLEDRVPHHSSLTRIRDRLGEKTFEKIFEAIVDQCCSKGIVTGKSIITDGTLIEANACVDKMKRREEYTDDESVKKKRIKLM